MLFIRSLLAASCLVSALTTQVAWTQLVHPISPGDRFGHAMAYDQARGETVLFGGAIGALNYGDTWTFDGTAWRQRGVSGPAPRVGHSMVYDAGRQVVVLFGGNIVGSGTSNDTWEWDGVGWIQRTPATTPPPRSQAAIAQWPALGGVVIHGGYPVDGTPHFWRWDGNDWTDLTTATTPNEAGHSMAYHAGLRRLVVLGPSLNHTWDGADWTAADASVVRRRHGRLIYDSVLDRVVAFGGVSANSYDTYLQDTWSWRGVWTRLDTPSTPTGRLAFDMVFDPSRTRAVLFGGHWSSWFSSGTLGDMHALEPVTSPAPHVEAHASGFGFTTDCPYVGDGLFSLTEKPMLHTGGGRAWLGESFAIICSRVGGTFNPTPIALLHGASDQVWNGVPLPADLSALGRPDCDLLVAPSLDLPAVATRNVAWHTQIPNVPALAGSTHYFQALGVSLHGPLFTSSGIEVVIGRR